MAARTMKWTPERKARARRLASELRSISAAAKVMGCSDAGLRGMLRAEGVSAMSLLGAPADRGSPEAVLGGRLRDLEAELKKAQRELEPLRVAEAERRARAEAIEAAIVGAGGTALARWNVTREPPKTGPGIPSLLLSDLHMNQCVDSAQVLGVNSYSPEKARQRLKTTFRTAVDLGRNHMVRPTREGIVVPVLGDLLDILGGNVHRSERQASPVGIDAAALVADALQPGFVLLADAFGGVRSYWASGNHGRLTADMPYEDRNAKNLDYAVFKILEGRLRGDKRITLEHAAGPRLLWTVYGHRFLGLHGDPASGMPKGGDSEAGAANVVARGLKRLRSLHLQINRPFDTALMGHFHAKIELSGALVNGCLPGFGEYSNGRAFPFEPPLQRFFYTHPKYGITCVWNIYPDKGEAKENAGAGVAA